MRRLFRRPLVWVLAISLALNVFVAAAVVGHVAGAGAFGGGPRGQAAAVRAYVRGAPEDIRRQAREIRDARRPLIRAAREAARDARRERRAALVAEPFDPDRLRAANAAVHDARRRVVEIIDAGFTDWVLEMPPEERRALAAELDRADRRRGGPPGR